MKSVVFGLALALINCTSLEVQRDPAALHVPLKLNPKSADFSSVRSTLLDNPAMDSIEAFLADFEGRYPEFLRQRVAAYASGSIQEASFTEPRVIVFGFDAKFVFSFNGGPHQYGGASLETMQFDNANKQFLFREVTFKKAAGSSPTGLDANEIDIENDRIIVSKANPSKCLVCHGQAHPGPIQDNHYTWAGFYGSNDDLLFGSFNKASYTMHGGYTFLEDLVYPRSQGRWLDLPSGVADVELNGYLQYLKGASTHPRYKYLPPQIFEEGFRKYARGIPMAQIDESGRIHAEAKRTGIEEPDRINNHFTTLLLRLEFSALVAAIEKQPGLKDYLKNKLDDILTNGTYPFFFGNGRYDLVNDWQSYFKQNINNLSSKPFTRLNPAFGSYYRKIIADELAMQTSTVQQIESIFGHELQINPGWPGYGQLDETKVRYEKFLGRKLTHTEVFGLDGEASYLPALALLGYILKSRGIDLHDFDINSRLYSPAGGRVRAISFHDNFIPLLMTYLEKTAKAY